MGNFIGWIVLRKFIGLITLEDFMISKGQSEMMRMAILVIGLSYCNMGWGQDSASVASDSSKIQLKDIEVNFLFSYYEQDGNHSPVTGGSGTEFLTNSAPSININFPIDTINTVILNGGIDYYSSASSDNINNPYLNPDHVSSASAADQRGYATATWKRKKNKTETGIMAGFSTEYDVTSISGGLMWGKASKDNNRSIDFKLSYYHDNWSLIYPIEHRGGSEPLLPTRIRQTVNTSAIYSFNINTRLSGLVAADFVYQKGLLSTPFHRVYFQGQDQLNQADQSSIERLPGQRMKYPIGLRLNYHATDWLILKSFYRYYMDTWGLTGHTLELTMPLKISQSLRLYPFYRYNLQNQADYFAPYQEHTVDALFYTSDFDLSSFTSHKYGIGFTYTPLFGLARWKLPKHHAGLFKSVSVRYANYTRSDGLTANVVTAGMQFNIQRFRK